MTVNGNKSLPFACLTAACYANLKLSFTWCCCLAFSDPKYTQKLECGPVPNVMEAQPI